MSDIFGELARVRAAFDKPTLTLLDRKWAPLVLAVFSSSFSREVKTIPADRLHVQVDAYFAELAALGEDVPQATGRAMCVQWMNDQWLYRSLAEDGLEEYSLTSHALEALGLIDSLARDRALISESRLTTILNTVRAWAHEANPDPEERIRYLDARIAELEAERDYLTGGGDIPAASDKRMMDGYANVIDLLAQLPSDFKRVEEAVQGMHRQIINAFRHEERPIVEVIDEYLATSDRLMESTPEGRAFEGALEVLRDRELLTALRHDIETILGHPFAHDLTAAEKVSLRATVKVISRGIEDILTQRSRLTATLRNHIVNHDVVQDREMEHLLRRINQELAVWVDNTGPRATVTVELMPGVPEIVGLRERFYDPGADAPPPPLEDVSLEAPDAPTLTALRTQGGPRVEDMRRAIAAFWPNPDQVSMGAMFNMLDPDLRRPVEVMGLLQLLTSVAAIELVDGTETFHTIRPDHSTRTFIGPRITVESEHLNAIAALEGTTHDG